MVVSGACDGGTTMKGASSRIPGGPGAKRVVDRPHGADPAGLQRRRDEVPADASELAGSAGRRPAQARMDKRATPFSPADRGDRRIIHSRKGTRHSITFAAMHTAADAFHAATGCHVMTRGGHNADFVHKFPKGCGDTDPDASAALTDKLYTAGVPREAQKSGMGCLVPAARYQGVCRAMGSAAGRRKARHVDPVREWRRVRHADS